MVPSAPVLLPDEVEADPLDLSDVVIKRRNWNDPGIIIPHGGYTGVATGLTVEPYSDLCSQVGTATTMAVYMDIHLLRDGSGDIACVPAAQKSKNSLEVTWAKGGETFRIDFAPLFMKRPFMIPEQTRAHLPVEFKTIKGVGPSMVIHFSDAAFAKVAVGSRPRKKTNPAPTAPTGAPSETR